MKNICRTSRIIKATLGLLLLVIGSVVTRAGTTIDAANHFAYGANIGWIDCRGDVTHGAVLGEYVCSGFIYSANVGWINFGNGSPTNRIHYQNVSSNDFGVNHDGLGNLSGFAYGANIGWINFEANGAPKINLQTGNLSGYAYSANCGWISLSNAFAHVQTDTLSPGTLDANGLPIAWELTYFGTTNVNPNADPDHDGQSNLQEYLAGTDPTDANSVLRITNFGILSDTVTTLLVWTSVPTRNYHIQATPTLISPVWADSGLGVIAPASGSTTIAFPPVLGAFSEFYRVSATLPLSP
jgi:hypothetical protein